MCVCVPDELCHYPCHYHGGSTEVVQLLCPESVSGVEHSRPEPGVQTDLCVCVCVCVCVCLHACVCVCGLSYYMPSNLHLSSKTA